MIKYFDKFGEEISMDRWADLMEDPGYSTVGKHHDARSGRSISTVWTVWTGLDMSMGHGGPPIIFETMIFGGDYDQDQYRYSTWGEAVVGHIQCVHDLTVDQSPWWHRGILADLPVVVDGEVLAELPELEGPR